ncbi:MAG: hypothetical protein V3T64_03635 [Myxococcota bacterium]
MSNGVGVHDNLAGEIRGNLDRLRAGGGDLNVKLFELRRRQSNELLLSALIMTLGLVLSARIGCVLAVILGMCVDGILAVVTTRAPIVG